ncbi:MAG: hypothetical protein AB8F74_00460 [Saprospiraceae bacterium]
MTKKEFFTNLEEIVTDHIFIAIDKEDLQKEIETNCWSISIPIQLIEKIKEEELTKFIERIKHNRKDQLNKSDKRVDLLYYSWHDEMSSQFKFNFINANHNQLPFGIPIIQVESESKILTNFLKSNSQKAIRKMGSSAKTELEVYTEKIINSY